MPKKNQKKQTVKKQNRRTFAKGIFALCDRVANGNVSAEKKLAHLLKISPKARSAAELWVKHKGFKGKRTKKKEFLGYENAYKIYQGGIPGSGKRS